MKPENSHLHVTYTKHTGEKSHHAHRCDFPHRTGICRIALRVSTHCVDSSFTWGSRCSACNEHVFLFQGTGRECCVFRHNVIKRACVTVLPAHRCDVIIGDSRVRIRHIRLVDWFVVQVVEKRPVLSGNVCEARVFFGYPP